MCLLNELTFFSRLAQRSVCIVHLGLWRLLHERSRKHKHVQRDTPVQHKAGSPSPSPIFDHKAILGEEGGGV